MFEMKFPDGIGEMMEKLEESGFSAHLVGGCVRDAVMGITPHDYDITTNARPHQIIEIFGENHCSEYGRAFGTVGVKCGGAFAEITTYRTEKDYSDGRHPDTVEFADALADDLERRDFTWNAMAYSPKTGLFDPFDGRHDLQNGVLRCVGTAQARFHEDALRILRGLRFCARFGFTPEPLTAAAMRAGAFRLEMISAERVFSELCGMLMGEHVTQVLLEFPEVLSVRIPEISPCIAFSQHSRHHDFTVWEHTAYAVGKAPVELPVRLSMLLHDIGKPVCFSMDERGGHFKGHAEVSSAMADAILRRLKCDNRMRELVTKLVILHRDIPDSIIGVRKLLGELSYAEFMQFLEVLRADNAAKLRNGMEEASAEKIRKAAEYAEICRNNGICCRISELSVNGSDLISLGLQGKEIGNALRFLLDAVISERCDNKKEDLLLFLAENKIVL